MGKEEKLCSWKSAVSFRNERYPLKLHYKSSEAQCLPVFESLNWPPVLSEEKEKGFVLNVGGAVWGMDWLCTEDSESFLAIGTHPPSSESSPQTKPHIDSKWAEKTPGRNLIQLWQVPSFQQTIGTPPQMVYGIAHESGSVWDLKWSPHQQQQPLLAACMGDGSFQVFCIPFDRIVKSCTVVVEDLSPIVLVSMPSVSLLTISWSPHDPNLVLTGASDGSIFLWNLADCLKNGEAVVPNDSLQPMRKFNDVTCVVQKEFIGWSIVRAIDWCPENKNTFASFGHDNIVKLWDIREPRIPIISYRMTFSFWGLGLKWDSSSTIVVSGDSGSVNSVQIEGGSSANLYCHRFADAAVWDLSVNLKDKSVPFMGSCDAAGFIRLCTINCDKKRSPTSLYICQLSMDKSVIESEVKSEDNTYTHLSLKLKSEVVSNSALISDKNRTIVNRTLSLHRIRLNGTKAVACGGEAGLVIIKCINNDVDRLFAKKRVFGRPKKNAAVKRESGLSECEAKKSRVTKKKEKKKVVCKVPKKVPVVKQIKGKRGRPRINSDTEKMKPKVAKVRKVRSSAVGSKNYSPEKVHVSNIISSTTRSKAKISYADFEFSDDGDEISPTRKNRRKDKKNDDGDDDWSFEANKSDS